MTTERPPTERQRRFAEAITGPAMGNGTEAARLAGYKGSDNVLAVQASTNLRNPKVVALIEEMNAAIRSKAIMTAEERQQWLTKVVRGEVEDTALLEGVPKAVPAGLRMKLLASEQLNKMQGTENLNVTSNGAPVSVTFTFPADGRGPAPKV